MPEIGIVGLLIIITNLFCSYKGFTNSLFFENYKFQVDRVLIDKDYFRMVSSGFLHGSWMHLILNMASLYVFSGEVEKEIGSINFALLYFASLIGGDLLALYVHRQHGDYSAIGASGAICGVIFASIVLFPGLEIGMWLLPFFVPAWFYGLAYVIISIYGIGSKSDNIGHEAHLGGGIIGLLAALAIRPEVFSENYLAILLTGLPAIAFLLWILLKPETLLISYLGGQDKKNYYDIDHLYNEKKTNKQKELDRILEKIKQKGMSSLTQKEKEILDDF